MPRRRTYHSPRSGALEPMWLNEVQVDFKEVEEFGHQLLIRVGEPDTCLFGEGVQSTMLRSASTVSRGRRRDRMGDGSAEFGITVCCRPATVTSGIGSPGFDVDFVPKAPSLSFLCAPGLPQRFTLYACVSDRCRINQPASSGVSDSWRRSARRRSSFDRILEHLPAHLVRVGDVRGRLARGRRRRARFRPWPGCGELGGRPA